MSLALDQLNQLHQAFRSRPPSRMKALQLPPTGWTGTKDGEFGALELESGALGRSHLLLDGTLMSIAGSARSVAGADPFELARLRLEATPTASEASGRSLARPSAWWASFPHVDVCGVCEGSRGSGGFSLAPPRAHDPFAGAVLLDVHLTSLVDTIVAGDSATIKATLPDAC